MLLPDVKVGSLAATSAATDCRSFCTTSTTATVVILSRLLNVPQVLIASPLPLATPLPPHLGQQLLFGQVCQELAALSHDLLPLLLVAHIEERHLPESQLLQQRGLVEVAQLEHREHLVAV